MHRHLYEILFVIVLIAVIVTVLLRRGDELARQAEEVQVQRMVRHFESAARIHMAELIVRGRASDIPAMARSSPAQWLDPASAEIAACPSGTPETGAWCFDGHVLAYRYRAGKARVSRWRLELLGDPPRDLAMKALRDVQEPPQHVASKPGQAPGSAPARAMPRASRAPDDRAAP